ncbi:hypothetical protein BJV77DRAFT_635004 [Russula vinacea]|nr:hypothetical protein BJV77DRAFT_635004 [Russula vinacea]
MSGMSSKGIALPMDDMGLLLARVSTLLAVILNMVGFDTTTPINCQALAVFEMSFAYLAFALSSLLIVLRVIAIWNRAKIIIAISMSIWVTDISLFIYGTIRLRSTWSPETLTCIVDNFESTKPLLLVHSFPTLCYFSSCLLGCAPCAAVRLLWDARSGSRVLFGSYLPLRRGPLDSARDFKFEWVSRPHDPDSQYDYSDDCGDEAVSLAYKHLLFDTSHENSRGLGLQCQRCCPSLCPSHERDGVAERYKAHEISFNVDVSGPEK